MSTTLTFRIVNVFTQGRDPFSGNPLCVFEDGSTLDDSTMQKLARQFNLSETTFVLPSTRADARVRIFTPDFEMPFAGHPTLGTAFVCRALGKGSQDKLTLETTAGVIPVSADSSVWTLQANAPTWREVDESSAELAAILRIDVSDIGDRPLWVAAGKEQLIIPLRSEPALRRVQPDAQALLRIRSQEGRSMAYVFAETSPGRCLARFFFPQGSALAEDPATGSATANLGGWLLAMSRSLPARMEIAQGEYADRPSTLHLHVDAEQRIFVAGEVVELGNGTITIP